MKIIDPAMNSERENYKLLIGSIVPRPIAFVTSRAHDGTLNGAPFSYFSIVSAAPPMISLAVQRKNGRMKDTARNILSGEQFVVHIVDMDNVEKVNQTAASLAPDESEIELAGFETVPSEAVDVPGVKEAKIRMECVLERALELGEGTPGTDLLIGRVVKFHIDDKIYEDGKIDIRELAAVSRLAGADYAEIGTIFTIERPE